jgi:hypothetical protein
MRPSATATATATATSKTTSSIKIQRHALCVLNGSFMAINLCMGLCVYHIASTCAATVNDHHASLSAQHLHSKTKPATFRQRPWSDCCNENCTSHERPKQLDCGHVPRNPSRFQSALEASGMQPLPRNRLGPTTMPNWKS